MKLPQDGRDVLTTWSRRVAALCTAFDVAGIGEIGETYQSDVITELINICHSNSMYTRQTRQPVGYLGQ